MPNLKNLTNDELIEYHQLFKNLSKRGLDVKIHDMDTKFSYHILRLLDEAEQILTEGDLDLTRNREQLKSVRRGEWKEEDIRSYFAEKEKALETVYLNSKLPWRPDEYKIKQLLLQCLETHYGSLDNCIINMDKYAQAVKDIKRIIDRV